MKRNRTNSEPGARRRKKFDDKRQYILGIALSVFSKFGFHGTTIEQVASAADISKTNLFYYFKSKEELYLTILENILKDWLAPVSGFNEVDDPKTVLENYIRLKLELSRDQPEASKLFCLEIIQGAPILKGYLTSELKPIIDEKSKVVEKWIEQGKIKPIDPTQLIFIIWATTQHYADFSVQIKALTGKDLKNKAFFEETCQTIQRVVLSTLV
ncbi:HTH-type transcriptional regulator RutR [Thiomicrorhabdus sp.]|uniref:HTH-type transcriptional regulator RutR n=1 Tax=Thiomicrorhabdus sp. TaxID=2039724 RepID=UPI0029C6D7B6|nr:HTH-type transcriptional regulator RutR [Thiomicrorhabdus sp.]